MSDSEEDRRGDSVHADSVNEPDMGLEKVSVFVNGEKMVEEEDPATEKKPKDPLTPSRIPNKCLNNLSEPKPEEGTAIVVIPKGKLVKARGVAKKKSFKAAAKKAKKKRAQKKLRDQHAEGKRSVGLKRSVVKKRIGKKAHSAKSSAKKMVTKSKAGK
jgi:hypothetical protein